MKRREKKLFGLSKLQKKDLIQNIRQKPQKPETEQAPAASKSNFKGINPEYYEINSLPGMKALQMQMAAAKQFGLENVITSYSIHYTKLYEASPTSIASISFWIWPRAM